jgi:hypothetical protein
MPSSAPAPPAPTPDPPVPTPVPLSTDARPPAPALPVSLKVIISALVAGLLPALVIGLVLRFEVHMASWAINGAYVSLTAVFLSAMLRWLKPRLKPRHAVLIVTWLSVSLLERLFLWHSGTARWFTLDLAPGNLKTALIWTTLRIDLGSDSFGCPGQNPSGWHCDGGHRFCCGRCSPWMVTSGRICSLC